MSKINPAYCTHISDTVVALDIAITEKELEQLQEELAVLVKDPVKNKFSIMCTENGICERSQFIAYLKRLQDWRKKNPKEATSPC